MYGRAALANAIWRIIGGILGLIGGALVGALIELLIESMVGSGAIVREVANARNQGNLVASRQIDSSALN
jgi:hypothetical protein